MCNQTWAYGRRVTDQVAFDLGRAYVAAMRRIAESDASGDDDALCDQVASLDDLTMRLDHLDVDAAEAWRRGVHDELQDLLNRLVVVPRARGAVF